MRSKKEGEDSYLGRFAQLLKRPGIRLRRIDTAVGERAREAGMDGVLIKESEALTGSAELIQQWRDEGTPFLVLTNNSMFTPRDLAAHLLG